MGMLENDIDYAVADSRAGKKITIDSTEPFTITQDPNHSPASEVDRVDVYSGSIPPYSYIGSWPNPDPTSSPTLAYTPTNIDPLLRAMFDRLPPPGSTWPIADRHKWLGLLVGIIEQVYQE
jgi:hypothetical protein